jgi:histidine triad (HIT) family protein
MNMQKDTCIFCKIAKKEIPAKVVFEDESVLAFEDIKPQAPVHIIVVPKIHVERISNLTADHAVMIGKLILTAKDIARTKGIEASGYRLVLNCNKDAGQEVFHIHLHLLGGRKMHWPPG